MTDRSDKRVVIVGAGVAGLTLALQLARRGLRPLVIERESEVGGLARSFSYDGFTFDIGPHRFHTDNPLVDRFVREVLGNDLVEIERRSGVWMAGHYLEWPLGLSAAFKLPFRLLFASAVELFKKRESKEDSFESYIISRYGRPLYEVFFRPYTEKFLGIPCSGISRDWAVTGIDRAVIDSSVSIDNLGSLVLSAFNPQPSLQFIYPKSGGIGVFSQRLAAMVEQAGGEIISGESVQGVQLKDGGVAGVTLERGVVMNCSRLYWTASLTELQRQLGLPFHDMEFLSIITYNYRVREPARIPYQWCYFGAANIPFNRVSIPSMFNPALSPPGKTGLCVERTCRVTDSCWQEPEPAEPEIRRVLAEVGIIGSEALVEGVEIERVREAYPMYSLGYQNNLAAAVRDISGISNLFLAGRSGRFWYNNMDNSIEDALKMAELTG